MSGNKENIHTAIISVMDKVGYVKKQSAQGLRYTYTGEAALIAAIRPHMIANDITMHVSRVDDRAESVYQTSKGTSMNRVSLTVTVTFTHALSMTSIVVESRGEGADVGDKATPKAMTAAYKYALRQTFVIETGDDPDKEASVPRKTSDEVKWRSFIEELSVNADELQAIFGTVKITTWMAESQLGVDQAIAMIRQSREQQDKA